MATKAEITNFVAKAEAESNADLAATFSSGTYDHSKKFNVKFGRKYAKVIASDANSTLGSVWGFIDIESGDILKAAGWSKPAKHSRGNIATAAYGRNYVWTGPNYLK